LTTAERGPLGASAPPASGLTVRLDAPLPRELEVGAGTALFVCGTCFHRDLPIRELSFVLDGRPQPVGAHGMPRLDEFQALHPALDVYETGRVEFDPESREDPNLHGYLAGFWGTVKIGPRPEGPFELGLRAELEDGSTATAPLATVTATGPLARQLPDPPQAGSGPLVAICMATYNPPLDLFHRQVESIRSQTHTNWICVVSDDRSSPGRFAAIERELSGDPRFVLSRSPRRLGFYRNFERALALVPERAEFVALSDQDDRWYDEKLAVLLEAVEGAQLAYSDVRVIDDDGGLISDTYWTSRRNNYHDLLSVLVANCVTGGASLFRRELLRFALPFPPSQFGYFHDHWIALVALSLGDISFVEEPLYDYVQHRDAVLGHRAANRVVAFRERLGRLYANPRERVRLWRFHYFVDASRLTLLATVLELRCSGRMPLAKRRSLRRFLRTERSLCSLLNLWRRGLRELVGTPETLGGEWMLAYAFTWRRLLPATVRRRPARRLRFDALPPPDLWMNPGAQAPAGGPSIGILRRAAPLLPACSAAAPARINVLIPTIDPGHVSPALVRSLNLALRLAEHGLHARLVTIEPVGTLPGTWKRSVEREGGPAGVFDRIEVAFAREARDLEVSPRDGFIATTAAGAHVAHGTGSELGGRPFLYLIDSYEPLAAQTGSDVAVAEESYRLPHLALFSSEPLRAYFRHRGVGVYDAGAEQGDRRSRSYQPAITPVTAPARRLDRRLLFLGRPEAPGRANVFELGVAALREALGEGVLGGWALDCVGALDSRTGVRLAGGAKLRLVPAAEGAYDVALVLDLAPSPSLEAIGLAAAGVVTVTNTYETKTAEALSTISANLVPAEPTVGGIAQALGVAAARAADLDARAQGRAVAWSHDWGQSFDAQLIDWIAAQLGGD
jgi:glycosyltransferase involved in cell wall biosynthesis